MLLFMAASGLIDADFATSQTAPGNRVRNRAMGWSWSHRSALRAAGVAFLGLGLACATAARAQTPTTNQLIEAACDSNVANVEYKQCLLEFAAKVDRDLNALWPRVLASIESSTHLSKSQRADWKASLTTAQRHWIQFKEADCREPVGYEWYGGSGMGGAVSICFAKHTLDRTQELRDRYLDR